MFHSKLLQEIEKKGFTEIEYPLSKKDIDLAMNSFLNFLEHVPQEEKETLSLVVPFKNEKGEDISYGNDRGISLGYKKKIQEEGDLDSKEYFHYNPQLENLSQELNLSQEYENFLSHAKKIYDLSCEVLKKELEEIESDLPEISELLFPKENFAKHELRFLKYKSAKAGSFIAKGHYDKGFFTIAIAESAPGLRLGIDPSTLYDAKHKEGKALFFSALNLREIASPLKACWHEVVQKEEDNIGKECSRWALVFFVTPSVLKSGISHEDTHTLY